MAGAYFHRERLIVIDARLSPVRTRETLAHEYVHAVCGHDGQQLPAVEEWVDRRAAFLLIDPDAYARAEQIHEGNIAGIAEELGVTLECVSLFRAQHEPAVTLRDVGVLAP